MTRVSSWWLALTSSSCSCRNRILLPKRVVPSSASGLMGAHYSQPRSRSRARPAKGVKFPSARSVRARRTRPRQARRRTRWWSRPTAVFEAEAVLGVVDRRCGALSPRDLGEARSKRRPPPAPSAGRRACLGADAPRPPIAAGRRSRSRPWSSPASQVSRRTVRRWRQGRAPPRPTRASHALGAPLQAVVGRVTKDEIDCGESFVEHRAPLLEAWPLHRLRASLRAQRAPSIRVPLRRARLQRSLPAPLLPRTRLA